MKLVHFSLQNYRSIRRTEQLSLSDLTALVGPNNEGKSNILMGLVAGMRLLEMHAHIPSGMRRGASMILRQAQRSGAFDFDRDVPISLQDRAGTQTIFDFEFELTEREVAEFKETVRSNLNGQLPVRLTVDADGVLFEVRKRGPGAKTLTNKSRAIARFIGARISVEHIPAVRTGGSAVRMVQRMVEEELRGLENSEEYLGAVAKIAELQQPLLDRLQAVLCGSLSQFLPDVSSVQVNVQDRFSALRRDCEVVIDDGVATPLAQKGDGVQSMAALSLAHHLSRHESGGSGAVMLAIEEPEAHLHPRAIHALRRVLSDLASDQQVVITTHSPLLTNRADVSQNIIVHRNKAKAARSLTEIREVLGVEVGDNLSSAELVLLLEGETDVTAVKAILQSRSPGLSTAISDGRLAMSSIRGVRNLANHVTLLRGFMCAVHAFLDHDRAGMDAYERARDMSLLDASEVTFATSVGMRESEIEDLYDVNAYRHVITDSYGVSFPTPDFDRRRARWSERIARDFHASGQPATDLTTVKHAVARAVASAPEGAIAGTGEGVVVALVSNLERRLEVAG